MHFAQDGGDLPRDQWCEAWPRSKKGNEWVRAFGLTYTLLELREQHSVALGAEIDTRYKLTVVGPGGVRIDRTYHYDVTSDDVKELLWPSNRERPFNIEELQQGEGT